MAASDGGFSYIMHRLTSGKNEMVENIIGRELKTKIEKHNEYWYA